jgi:hypothetical protein
MRTGLIPQTWKRLGETADCIKQLPGLLIVTYRPEFEAPWVGWSYVSLGIEPARRGRHLTTATSRKLKSIVDSNAPKMAREPPNAAAVSPRPASGGLVTQLGAELTLLCRAAVTVPCYCQRGGYSCSASQSQRDDAAI